jgi:hypothetical protein
VGSVWALGGVGPTTDFRMNIFQAPDAADAGAPVLRKDPAGSIHMANTTMETWMQTGSTGFEPKGVQNDVKAGCFQCHHLPNDPSTAAFPQGDLSHIFAKIKSGPKTKLLAAHPQSAAVFDVDQERFKRPCVDEQLTALRDDHRRTNLDLRLGPALRVRHVLSPVFALSRKRAACVAGMTTSVGFLLSDFGVVSVFFSVDRLLVPEDG